MPLYEYFCPPCGNQFEVLRPVSQMDQAAVCPSGHTTNNRVLSMFSVPRSFGRDTMTLDMPQMGGGGSCCGGGSCSCGS